jgi:hypothetical protein
LTEVSGYALITFNMSKEKEQQNRTTDLVVKLEESLKNPLKRSEALTLFRSLTEEVVRGILDRDPAIGSVLGLLGEPDMLGLQRKGVNFYTDPVYLQGRLDASLDVVKVASGIMISGSMGNRRKEKAINFLRLIVHPIKTVSK